MRSRGNRPPRHAPKSPFGCAEGSPCGISHPVSTRTRHPISASCHLTPPQGAAMGRNWQLTRRPANDLPLDAPSRRQNRPQLATHIRRRRLAPSRSGELRQSAPSAALKGHFARSRGNCWRRLAPKCPFGCAGRALCGISRQVSTRTHHPSPTSCQLRPPQGAAMGRNWQLTRRPLPTTCQLTPPQGAAKGSNWQLICAAWGSGARRAFGGVTCGTNQPPARSRTSSRRLAPDQLT